MSDSVRELLGGRGAERGRDVAQVVHQLDQLAVATGGQHAGVEPLVVVHEPGGVAVDGGRAHRRQLLVQGGRQSASSTWRAARRTGRDLQQQAEVEDLGDVGVVAFQHAEAAVAGDLDHAGLGEPEQPLPHRGPGRYPAGQPSW